MGSLGYARSTGEHLEAVVLKKALTLSTEQPTPSQRRGAERRRVTVSARLSYRADSELILSHCRPLERRRRARERVERGELGEGLI